jgi:hypothetical protein
VVNWAEVAGMLASIANGNNNPDRAVVPMAFGRRVLDDEATDAAKVVAKANTV